MTAAVVETPRAGTRLRHWLFWILASVAAILLAGFTLLSSFRGLVDQGLYSPTSPSAAGSKALVQVLKQQGVDVVETGSLDETRQAVSDASGRVTVMMADLYGYLDDDKLESLGALDADLVLPTPSQDQLDILAPGVRETAVESSADTVQADCGIPAAERAGEVSQADYAYRTSSSDATGCFETGDGAYGLVRLDQGDRTVDVLGVGDALRNDSIPLAGNAALALGLLGEDPTLVWYLPGSADLPEDAPPTIQELTPGWVTPVILLLILVFVASAIWRGRRLGPVVVEEMPVVVRARETAEGRARLYARQGATLRAIDALRIGTVQRLSTALNLSRSSDLTEVVAAVSAVTGRPSAEVYDTLVGAVPAGEADLQALSDRLLVLEREVRTATRPD
ncbi:DUF4350 domain-containing protein [Cnuibacter sp. UC19_7]|uniref:DUF4350 domain-containing protein n=1 Tax=Cnuibacter sp. UC19_7 TaxID=3350166 RepID=UPI00366CB1AB